MIILFHIIILLFIPLHSGCSFTVQPENFHDDIELTDVDFFSLKKSSLLPFYISTKQHCFQLSENIWKIAQDTVVLNPITLYDAADPSYIKVGEYYYMFHTGKEGFIDRSRNLIEWEHSWSRVFPVNFDYNSISESIISFWAYDINIINKEFVLYVAAWTGSPNTSFIFAMKATSISGPWIYQGIVCKSYSKGGGMVFPIDPEYVSEEGSQYLFTGSYGISLSRLKPDGLRCNDGWNRIMNRDEGAYLYKFKDYYYLFTSGGNYNDYTYNVSISRSKTITGPYFNKAEEPVLQAGPTVILSSEENDILYGPGHCGEITIDKKGDMYILLHCHCKGLLETDSVRPLVIMRIVEGEDGWLAFADKDGNIVYSPSWTCSVPSL